ncbi:MAG TPA: CHRD domain-containing protein [Nitrososphaeraceae archaeon]
MVTTKSLSTLMLVSATLSLMFVTLASGGVVFAKQKFTASLSGSNEVPPVKINAGGEAKFTSVNNDTGLKYKVNVTGLSDATGAHIHTGKEGKNGAVVVDLLKNSKKNSVAAGMVIRGNITDSSLTGPMKGKTVADLISAMSSGDAYVNIHTPKHPKGEIRGQLESGNSSSTMSNQTNVQVG